MDGSCECPASCLFGCDVNGECIVSGMCFDDAECNDMSFCPINGCYCNDLNECVFIDANENHMHDRYENAANQGKDCRKYTDCDSAPGAGDGFCDSFIGYKCSTKCTSDSECVDNDGDDYHYVCRSDGRCAPDEFVTVWDISDDSQMLALPMPGTTCALTIDWGDQNIEEIHCEQPIQHTYLEKGKYTVRIKGDYNNFSMYDPSAEYNPDDFCYYYDEENGLTPLQKSASMLIEIKAFGPVALAKAAFYLCTHFTNVSKVDIPDASKLTNAHELFYTFSVKEDGCIDNPSLFNADIENWDVSNVTDMSWMFKGAFAFNHSLNRWDVSRVTNMEYMFYSAFAFDQPLGGWDVSNVKNMSRMFSWTQEFNQPIDTWDVSNVTDMSYMFANANSFNQPLDAWDVSSVTAMNCMFADASRFNQSLDHWDVSSVKLMQQMFLRATQFNGAIGNWNVSNVTNMAGMFSDTSFNQPINTWNVSNVTDMSSMFNYAEQFNQPLDTWNVSNVTDMSGMFFHALQFNQPIDSWDVSNVTDMNRMFYHAEVFNMPLGSWTVSSVTNMDHMFNRAYLFDQPLASWNVSENTDISWMFTDSGMSKENFCDIIHSDSWKCQKQGCLYGSCGYLMDLLFKDKCSE